VEENGAYTNLQNTTSPDAFDPYAARGSPPTAFNVFPLVFSAGTDGVYDIATDDEGTPVRYSQTTPANDPFTTSFANAMGMPLGDAQVDNVHNHARD
jgi:hypothetical protein